MERKAEDAERQKIETERDALATKISSYFDSLYLEEDDEAAAVDTFMQETINQMDIVQDYVLESLSVLTLKANDIAELKRAIHTQHTNGDLTFLEAAYLLSALNETTLGDN